jgi:hypothetical protein
MRHRPARMRTFLYTALAVASVAVPAAILTTALPAAAVTGTEISAVSGPFGPQLVVGNGPYKGFSIYEITSDNPPAYGCNTAPLTLGGQTLTCTGPEGDKTAVWPAVNTIGAPIAGPGVNPALLGTVSRPKVGSQVTVGTQVTYNGHPLYLFDDAPGMVTGEGLEDPASPLPHGTWFLGSPNGNQLPWTSDLTTISIAGHTRLAVLMNTLGGWVKFPVYTRPGPCNAACFRVWPYVRSNGYPGASFGVNPARIGLRFTPLGIQVTYRGQALYLFSQESVNLTTFLAAGNGNGVGGFHLVNP